MSALVDAWQAALRAEQRAVFGYSVLGPRLTEPDVAQARVQQDAHAELVARTAAALVAAGEQPADPAADYPDVYPVRDANAARALALRLEEQAAAAWRYLYATAAAGSVDSARSVRTAAQANLIASALRALAWRGAPVAFPGI